MALRKSKRPDFVKAVGCAVGKSFIDDWSTYGSMFFPNGPDGIPELAGRIAYVSLYTSCNWKVTEAEQEACAQAAVDYAKQHL